MSETINNPDAASTLPPGSSHLSPVPIGTKLKAKIERGDAYAAPEVFDVEISVLETIRGNEAIDLMKREEVSSGLPTPAQGFEFLIARIKFGYFRRGRGFGNKPYQLAEGQFVAFSHDGQTQYPSPTIEKQPGRAVIGEFFSPGDSREGFIVLQVPKDEDKPLLVFNREFVEGVYGIWGYIFFRLY